MAIFHGYVSLPEGIYGIIAYNLVGGLEHEFIFPYIGNVIIQTG